MTRFPAPIALQIWDMKYRFKDEHGKPIDVTVEDTWERIATALAQPEPESAVPMNGKKALPGRAELQRHFTQALEDFKFLPAGRIVAGAGTGRAVTLFNCYVMGTIPDSMDGIFQMLKEAALTMQQGGGIGFDFSTIRPKSSLVKKLGADASGPLSFMDCWDAMCRTVMSAGSRRGAMMATMRCDHPDIMDFITAKSDANRLRMFNLSVLVTDEFMEAVEADEDWALNHVEPPKNAQPGDLDFGEKNGIYIHQWVKARDLWNAIMESTYKQAEPGVIFIDRINKANNLNYIETIAATNPCGEQPLPPYGACLLGSINLASLVNHPFTEDAHIDSEKLKKLVKTAVRMLDNVIEISNFPLPEQAAEAKAKRRIGLGLTGLADALAMMGIRYGSDDAVDFTYRWMQAIDHTAYYMSVVLAEEKGAFPLFDADKFLAPGTHASTLPEQLQDLIRKHGIRNSLLTSIAPTGTISLYAGNVSSGIEPIFAYSYKRKVLMPDGSKREELVEDYAVAQYRSFWERQQDLGDENSFDPEKHLPDYFVNAQTLTPMDHLKMQAAAQRHVDSSISKTINCPEDIDFEDFKDIYWQAYKMGCKGCTTYRPNDITGSVLSVEPAKKEQAPVTASDQAKLKEAMEKTPTWTMTATEANWPKDPEPLPVRPEELHGSTYKIKVGDRKSVYLTINDLTESDGTIRPFEIFLRSSDPEHDEWMVALARMVSAIMRRPHDASFVSTELMRVSSAVSGGFQKGAGYQPSLVAAIGLAIRKHTSRVSERVIELPEVSEEVMTQVRKFYAQGNRPSADQQCQRCFSYNTKMESGCMTCIDCGESKCG